MSTIKKLEEAGLGGELGALFDKFVKGGDKAAVKELTGAIDETGLKSPKTMKVVGTLQRNGKLEPGLYKELVALNKRFESGDTAEGSVEEKHPEAEAPEGSASEKPSDPPPQAETPEGSVEDSKKVPEDEAATEEVDNVVEFGDLSAKEETRIKDRMRKEEEKMRKRLLAREAKMRERIRARADKRALRQGTKVETLQEVKIKKDELAKIREETKDLRGKAKQLREEIKTLRPQRKKKEKESKEGADGTEAPTKPKGKGKGKKVAEGKGEEKKSA